MNQKMKIATWNIERLKHIKQINDIIYSCKLIAADILVLTETDTRIRLPYKHSVFSAPLPSPYYKKTERRAAIYTNYEIIGNYNTFDSQTALCVELSTSHGALLVYGTIIGIYGNRNPSYIEEIIQHTKDFQRLSKSNANLCVCGDYNCSFVDNYYFTNEGRNLLRQSFNDNSINILTYFQKECIDHIGISSGFIKTKKLSIEEWNQSKILSDHKGIAITVL